VFACTDHLRALVHDLDHDHAIVGVALRAGVVLTVAHGAAAQTARAASAVRALSAIRALSVVRALNAMLITSAALVVSAARVVSAVKVVSAARVVSAAKAVSTVKVVSAVKAVSAVQIASAARVVIVSGVHAASAASLRARLRACLLQSQMVWIVLLVMAQPCQRLRWSMKVMGMVRRRLSMRRRLVTRLKMVINVLRTVRAVAAHLQRSEVPWRDCRWPVEKRRTWLKFTWCCRDRW
jgi:hypothetical protein